MLRNNYRTKWRGRSSVAALLALGFLAAGCSSGGVLAPPLDSSGPPSITDKISGFFTTSSAKAPQTVAGAQPDVSCPPIEIREGASTLIVGPGGTNATMSLQYQGSFVRSARECAMVGGNMVMKIGVEGRIIIGPAGGPGQVDVPLRIAVVQETPGGSKPIFTKFIRVPVAVPAQGAIFTHIEPGLSFPLPTPTTLLDDYVAYVGFDPLAAQAQENPKAKSKAKARPKPSAGSG